ncbi:MAG: hypothetical protein GEV13_10730 [Rhodospirillales bacterium]|nr:hypothetical protein [Rhodospirillales bacterium]
MADLEVTTNAFTPMAFVREVVTAVLPLMDKDQLREGKSRADVFEALTPICGHYSVVDAFLAWRLLNAAENASIYIEDTESGALHQAAYMLETFVAHGWPSSADCVSARAAALEIVVDGEHAMGDVNDDAARGSLTHDVLQLRCGRYHGDRFDRGEDHLPNNWPLWLDRAMGEAQ